MQTSDEHRNALARSFRACLGAALLLCSTGVTASASAAAVELRVNNRADQDASHFCTGGITPCTLRTAFRLAAEHPENTYTARLDAQGIYVITSSLRLPRGSLRVISSFKQVNRIVIDARDRVRALHLQPSQGETAQLSLDGLIVRRGYTSDSAGGALVADRATLRLSRTIFEDNESVGFGAGILVSGGTLQMSASTLRRNDNASTTCGGGLFRTGAGLALLNGAKAGIDSSTIEENHACRGGGILVSGSRLTMVNSTVSGNIAETRGGGLLALGDNQLFLRFNTITQNVAGFTPGDHLNYGGGIAFAGAGGRIVLTGNLIAGNEFVGRQTSVLNAVGTMGHDCFIEGDLPSAANGSSVPANTATADSFNNLFGTLGEQRSSRSGQVKLSGGVLRTVSNCGVLAAQSLAGRDQKRLDPNLQSMVPTDDSVPYTTPYYEAWANWARRDNFRSLASRPGHTCLRFDQRGLQRPGAPTSCEIGSVETNGVLAGSQ